VNQTELQKTLETLHAELNNATYVDDSTRSMLLALAKDIERLSNQQANQQANASASESASESIDEVEPLSERVQDLVLKFEADHPQLTTALNQVSAALANLGI